jgi:endonuclease YncB( thermonuclease family)
LTSSASVTGINPAWIHSRIASKGAAESVAPFAFWLLLLPVILSGNLNRQALAAACPADHTSERVQVAYIYDGDTVRLKDGRRIRFIGINTPELGHNDKPVQPLAQAARTSLTSLLDANDHRLLLQHGKQQYDHYGRALAHAFLENGENIAAQLLLQGLATTLVVPPNTWGEHCYQALENSARAERLGLWALKEYQPHDARSLSLDTRGFRIVNGRVTAIRRSRHNTWLDLEGPLTVQIPMKKLASFSSFELDTLTGRSIEVRGWIRPDRNKLKLKVQHAAALVIMTTPTKP